jgi:hypothetical protein
MSGSNCLQESIYFHFSKELDFNILDSYNQTNERFLIGGMQDQVF